MLVSISGSQSSGKSTVLDEITNLGYNVVARKTARSVLATEFPSWMTLDDIYSDPTTAVKWQEAILQRKLEDEHDAVASKELWFTERSYADAFAYAVMAVGKYNKYSEWLNSYYAKCAAANNKYLHIFYLQSGHFGPVADGVRGTNAHYQAMINDVTLRTTRVMSSLSFEPPFAADNRPDITQVDTPRINDRVRQIITKSTDLFVNAYQNTRPATEVAK